MGGRVLFALSIAAFPEDLPRDVLTEIFAGASAKVREAGGTLAGGHTIRDPEPKYGLAVIGAAHPDRLLRKGGARPGDRLVLTKPLGTGVLVSGSRQGRTSDGGPGDRDRRRCAASTGPPSRGARRRRHPGRDRRHRLRPARPWPRDGPRVGDALRRSTRRRCPPCPARSTLAAAGVETGGAAHNRRFVAGSLEVGAGRAARARDARPRSADLGRPPRGDPARPRRRASTTAFDAAGVEHWWVGSVEAGEHAGVALALTDPARRSPAACGRQWASAATAASSARIAEKEGRMRRFIVEVVLDALILARHHPVPRRSSRSASRSRSGRTSAPIVALRDAGIVGFAVVGGGPRPGQPVRPAGPRRPHRPAAVLDDGLLRRDHQRDRDLASPRSSPRSRSPIVADRPAPVDHRRGGAVHRPLDRRRTPSSGLNRPDLDADRSRGIWGFLESLPTPRRNVDHREPAAPAGLQRDLHDQPRHRPGGHAGRRRSGAGSRGSCSATRTSLTDATGPARIRRCSSSSARPT